MRSALSAVRSHIPSYHSPEVHTTWKLSLWRKVGCLEGLFDDNVSSTIRDFHSTVPERTMPTLSFSISSICTRTSLGIRLSAPSAFLTHILSVAGKLLSDTESAASLLTKVRPMSAFSQSSIGGPLRGLYFSRPLGRTGLVNIGSMSSQAGIKAKRVSRRLIIVSIITMDKKLRHDSPDHLREPRR